MKPEFEIAGDEWERSLADQVLQEEANQIGDPLGDPHERIQEETEDKNHAQEQIDEPEAQQKVQEAMGDHNNAQEQIDLPEIPPEFGRHHA